MGANKPLVFIASIFTAAMVALSIAAMVQSNVQPQMEANVITQEFAEEFAQWKMWNTLMSVTLIWSLIGVSMIFLGIGWSIIVPDDDGSRFIIPCILIITFIVVGFIFQPVSIFDIMDMAEARPRVQVAVISNKYYKRSILSRRDNRHTRNYYFVYSNGTQEEVSVYTYENTPYGKEYYVIACNDTFVGKFDTDLFRMG